MSCGTRLWDADRHIATVTVQDDGPVALDVAFDVDGTRLVTAGEDGQARMWTLDLDELLVIAEDRVTRGLTVEECRQYLHVDGCDAA